MGRADKKAACTLKTEVQAAFGIGGFGCSRIERVALRGVAALQAAAEPLQALGGCAVREAVGHGITAAALLQAVVAHGFGGVKGFFQIARFKQLPLLCAVGPHTGQAVCLQLELDRQTVGFAFAGILARAVHLCHRAGQVLHMVADFVGNHIGERRIARRAEFVFHVIVKR